VTRSGLKGALCVGFVVTALLGSAGTAHAADGLTLTVAGTQNGTAKVASGVTINGAVEPAGPGIPTTVKVTVGSLQLVDRQILTQTNGKFSMPMKVDHCCAYKITATTTLPSGPVTKNAGFNVKAPHLHPGSTGPDVAIFHSLLREQGYFVRGKKRFTSSTSLAILAFNKVNKFHRTEKYNSRIFKILGSGRGGFPLQHPEEGKHVEADLSRQVLVLAEDGKPKYTFPISSGASATPTVTGKFHFYLKTPGYNAKRMYYAAYFVGGYATHGYVPVPNYPASHGCIRNPIPDSVFIYNWINIGDTIFVYH
jgi:hypothetical protein